MMIRVKVCGMYEPLNVSEIGKEKPDFMGFIFYPASPRYVGEEPDLALFKNVPHSIKKTGVFVNEDNRKILDISVRTGLEIIQLHGNESPVTCLQLKSSGLTLIKTFNIHDEFSFECLNEYMPVCDYFLFDTRSEIPGGSGRKFNWAKLENYYLDKPFFLSGGIGPQDTDVIKSISDKGFFAVDINSRFESSPAYKDAKLVKKFIEEIKNEQP